MDCRICHRLCVHKLAAPAAPVTDPVASATWEFSQPWPAMLTAALREGRDKDGHLLLADACRLPLPTAAVDAVFSAGLINHVPDPATALREWARVTAPDGTLLLYHPSGRAERAARHGRPPDPDDPLAEHRLRPALRTAGWDLSRHEDAPHHFLARATRVAG